MSYSELEGVEDDEVALTSYENCLQVLVRRPEGRVFLAALLTRCRVLATGVTTEYAAGQRDVGLSLLQDIRKVSPKDAARILFEERT